MYGTIDKKDELEQQQQQPSPTASNNGGTADQEAESRRLKRIYSHCHIQSVDSDHDAEHDGRQGVDKSARRRLIVASITCLVFMVAEVVGGVLSNSLAIATDAAHLLTDFASFMISLFAIWLSSRPATRKMSFGWYRAEVIGALLSVLMIWLVTGLLVYMAIERLRTGKIEIDSFVMVVTASAGLLVNIIMAIALNVDGHGHGHFHSHGAHSHHNHSHEISKHSHLDHVNKEDADVDESGDHHQQDQNHLNQSVTIDCSMKEGLTKSSSTNRSQQQKQQQQVAKGKTTENRTKRSQCQGGETNSGRDRSNINVRAAFIHVIGDFLQSLGVLIAALIIHFEPSYAIVDPICTFLFSFIVLITTINIIRDATNVLMEGIPDGINFIEVHEKLQSLPNVIRVHNLRIWSLSLDKIAISTHLVIDTSRTTSSQALKSAIDALKSSFNFFEVTIQIEEYREDMKDCEHCQDEEVLPEIVVDNVATTTTNSTSYKSALA
uniref:Zinc transporter 2 n=1 Tax=Aceria tosichella TaxID=561515 RepID=A0A6G1S873_9ACAR